MRNSIVRKSLVFGIIFLFVGSSAISAFNVNTTNDSKPINRGYLYVGGSGPGNYTTIQSAIDNASAKDTVYVYSGVYYENVDINKPINLIGADKNTTIIDGNQEGPHGSNIEITADSVIVSNFTFLNTKGYYEFSIIKIHSNDNQTGAGLPPFRVISYSSRAASRVAPGSRA